MPETVWTVDEQQRTFVQSVFDIELHDAPLTITLADIDESASLSVGQNRVEMTLDADTIEILAMYMDEGVSMPMPLVWRASNRAKRVAVLDGNHRIAAALRKRGEPSCPAMLVVGDSQLAQRIAVVVNTQHGRSTRNPEYVATAMRMLREQGVPVAQIARMFGVSDQRVGLITRRDAQAERLRSLMPHRSARAPLHTLDLLGQIEDDHVRILGDLFLDAPRREQEDAIARLSSTSSARRDDVAHEIVGELRANDVQRRKVKPTTPRPSSHLQGALQRLVGVLDPTKAYYGSTDQQRAVMRSNLSVVLPRLQRLASVIAERQEVA
jgi:hypothetical protein